MNGPCPTRLARPAAKDAVRGPPPFTGRRLWGGRQALTASLGASVLTQPTPGSPNLLPARADPASRFDAAHDPSFTVQAASTNGVAEETSCCAASRSARSERASAVSRPSASPMEWRQYSEMCRRESALPSSGGNNRICTPNPDGAPIAPSGAAGHHRRRKGRPGPARRWSRSAGRPAGPTPHRAGRHRATADESGATESRRWWCLREMVALNR